MPCLIFRKPRLTLSEFFTGSIACVYISECLAFLKFKAGWVRKNPFKPKIPNLDVHSLDELEKRRIFSRNDPRYIRDLFKSRWQPLFAYIGIIGCSIVILFSGFPALFILGARSSLTDVSNLKKAEALVWDVIGAYFGVRHPSFSGALAHPWSSPTRSHSCSFVSTLCINMAILERKLFTSET